jgi:hypothetical protein
MNPESTMNQTELTKFRKLDGSNYYSWSHEIRNFLIIKDLYEPLEDDISEDDKLKAIDRKAQAYIYLTLNEDVAEKFRDKSEIKSAKSLWDALKKQYEKLSPQQECNLIREITSSKMNGNETIDQYSTRFKVNWKKLISSGGELSERNACNLFLSSLNQQHEQTVKIIFNLVSKEKPLTWEFITERLKLDETLAQFDELSIRDETTTKAYLVKPNRSCTNCGKDGHLARNCWFKGGGAEGQWPGPKSSKTFLTKNENEEKAYFTVVDPY